MAEFPIPEFDVVEREMWGMTDWQARRLRQGLRQHGFRLAKECWYNPTHWRVEPLTEDHGDEVYAVITEAYVPLTEDAKAWLMGVNTALADQVG
jgi:hypothetical protein